MGIFTLQKDLSLLRCGYKCKFWKVSVLKIRLIDDNIKACDDEAWRWRWLEVAEDVNIRVLLESYASYIVSSTTCTTFSFS